MKLKQYIYSLRRFRVFHRYLGLTLAIFLLISAVTGVLLALKKEFDFLQPPTQKGISTDLSSCLDLKQLADAGTTALKEKQSDLATYDINRIDLRPSKGIAKVIFEEGNWEVQVDATNGNILSIEKRWSDWIESLHDGSIVSDLFKVISMNFLGIGLFILICSGFWLWYGPRRFRALRKRR